ncbi:MAG: hypothetical protein NNA22_11575 [Nitrospira sp.]|nr:hypothetical protein [Nitrospira sp.]
MGSVEDRWNLARRGWLGACAMAPHDAIVSPAITGHVHRDGKLVENALMFLEVPTGEPCSFTSGASTRMDQTGTFHFEARRGRPFQILPSQGSFNRFQICMADGARRYQGWYERTVRMTGEKIVLDCNVQRPLPAYHETSSGKVMGICRADSRRE